MSGRRLTATRGTIGWYKAIEYLLDPLIFRGGGAADALVGGAGVVSEIVVDNLSHTFGKDTDDALTVLQDINLTFATGSFNTIAGTSGCGKSTLLKMMAVLFEPSDGRMTLDGDVIRGTSRRRGMVFQQDAVFPWMALAKNISYGPRLRGASRKEQAAIEARWISLPRPRSGEMRLDRRLRQGQAQALGHAGTRSRRTTSGIPSRRIAHARCGDCAT